MHHAQFNMTRPYRGRFAPSPTGRLHFGSLVAALGSWLFARAAAGRWIVRMEDIDREREAVGAAEQILATLSAFGLESDEPVVRQSQRHEHYAAALARLERDGHAYRCWCSRSDLESFDGIHPSTCVSAACSRTPAWRVRARNALIAFEDVIQGAQSQKLASAVGDFVVWRADGACAYQLAVVVDDAAQAITDVVRGADLLDSTARQILLQRLLGYPNPGYAHVPLALGADGRKLSKHEAALAVDATDPLPALRHALAFLGQGAPVASHAPQLLARASRDFDPGRIPRDATTPAAHAAMRKETS
jgi:glutamyl-Q tRNA(Asp) synthetase